MVFNLVSNVETKIMILDFDHYELEKLTPSLLSLVAYLKIPYTIVIFHGIIVLSIATWTFMIKDEMITLSKKNVVGK